MGVLGEDGKTNMSMNSTMDTELSLGLLASVAPNMDINHLLEHLLYAGGDVEKAKAAICNRYKHLEESPSTPLDAVEPIKHQKTTHQVSLKRYADGTWPTGRAMPAEMESRGVLRLHDPETVAEMTPCTLILDVFPAPLAESLSEELLHESKTWKSNVFWLFDRHVSSPHTSCFYVQDEAFLAQHGDYSYNGSCIDDIRLFMPSLLRAQPIVEAKVNQEIAKRARLQYESNEPWRGNVLFTNLYTDRLQNVGMHTDVLTYLGPQATIASLSLGVTREFRIRKMVPGVKNADTRARPISIYLPHNSLLIMHAGMQEQWKHSIQPARSIEPTAMFGTARINVTYRFYRDAMSPRHTPRCKCGVPMVLRPVMKSLERYGDYFWQCDSGKSRESSCSEFRWASFTPDGRPIL